MIAPLPGLLMAAEILISPFGLREDFAAVLTGVSGDPAREQLALWLGLAFSLTVLPGVLAVAWASRRRSPWFALAGGVLSVIGFSVGFAVPDSSAAALVAAQQGLDATKVAVINEVVSAATVVGVASMIFLVASSTGLMLLGVAQWRSRTGPRWLAVSARAVRRGAPPSRSEPLSRRQPGLPLGSAPSAHPSACFGRRTPTSTWTRRTATRRPALRPIWIGRSNGLAHSAGRCRAAARHLRRGRPLPAAVRDVGLSRGDLREAGCPPGLHHDQPVAGVVLGTTCLAGVVAVGWLSRRRVPMLTTIGLTLAVVGYTCLAIGNSFGELSTALVASHPEVDRATAYALGSGLELGPVSSVTGTLFVFGHLIGTIILGLALWRSHAVPTWAALLLAASQPIHLASVLLGSRPLDLVGWGGTALGFAAAGWALLHMNNEDFDLPPRAGSDVTRLWSLQRAQVLRYVNGVPLQ